MDVSQSIAVERAAALQLQFWQQVIAAALVAGLVGLAFERPGPVLSLPLLLLLAAAPRRREWLSARRASQSPELAAVFARSDVIRRSGALRPARAAAVVLASLFAGASFFAHKLGEPVPATALSLAACVAAGHAAQLHCVELERLRRHARTLGLPPRV